MPVLQGLKLPGRLAALPFSWYCAFNSNIAQQSSTDLGLCCCSNATVHPFTPVVGPSAWYADQYRNSSEHVYDLSSKDIAELDAAVAAVTVSSKQIQASPTLIFLLAVGRCLLVSTRLPAMFYTIDNTIDNTMAIAT